jgi:hypothetical protein
MDEKLSRRNALQHGAALGILAVVGATACGKKTETLSCTDTSGLTPADLNIRTTLAYADMSLELGKLCSKCQQFIPGAPNACGTCKIVKGPINPKGYCKSFVAKPTG